MPATLERTVARPKKPTASIRFDIRAEPEWLARVNRQADRLGISAAAYIRMVVSERLSRDETEHPASAKPGRPPAR